MTEKLKYSDKFSYLWIVIGREVTQFEMPFGIKTEIIKKEIKSEHTISGFLSPPSLPLPLFLCLSLPFSPSPTSLFVWQTEASICHVLYVFHL